MKLKQVCRWAAAGVSVLAATIVAASAVGQSTSRSPLDPPANGPRKVEPLTTAITGVTVHVKPGEVVENATVVMREGKIVDVAPRGGVVGAPRGNVRDGRGLHVYAGFIEPYVEVSVPRPDINAPGTHYNARVTPQRSALDKGASAIDGGLATTLRAQGFCAAAITPKGGVFRGMGAVVSLHEKSTDLSAEQPAVYRDKAYHSIAFDAGRGEDDDTPDDARWSRYPSSQMGAIAVIRQTLIDADWAQGERAAKRLTTPGDALSALQRSEGDKAKDTPLLFNVGDELEVLRAAKIAAEFERPIVVLGSGREYARLEAIQQSKAAMILPLNFPPAPKVDSIGQAESVGLKELMQWEQAPTNPRRAVETGLTCALTSAKISDKLGGTGSFQSKLSTAIKHGLKPDDALAMLTVNTAKLLGVDDMMGTVEIGKAANLVVADGPLFTDVPDPLKMDDVGYESPGRPGKIIEVYIDGQRHVTGERERRDLAGTWTVTLDPAIKDDPKTHTFEIDEAWPPAISLVETMSKPGEIKPGDKDPKAKKANAEKVAFVADPAGGLPAMFSFTINLEPLGQQGVVSIAAQVMPRQGDEQMRFTGDARMPDGSDVRFTAVRAETSAAAKPAKPFVGTWTAMQDGKQLKPDDNLPHLIVGPDHAITVKRKEREIKAEMVKNELDKTPAIAELKLTGVEIEKPDEVVELTINADASRAGKLSVTVKSEHGSWVFPLERYRATPETDAIAAVPQTIMLPLGAYAPETPPSKERRSMVYVIKNATIWTCGPAGVIENGGLILSGGTILFVGAMDGMNDVLSRSRFGGEMQTIDGTGLFVTPGIIDCHSHTGISKGVNEGGQAVTSEVRIGDVTNPDDISWYRQLAGGVTTVNSLHGSANVIGGQNQVNKVRWGCDSPDDMHFAEAIPGIKFALGENVKQSNWGDQATKRYPQTRMGVETLMRDRFIAAKEYAAGMKTDAKPRRDLELEALAEIIAGKRLIHCHSYRQDEMLMLCRIADEFGFTIGSFQHALEGYKVADEVRAHSLGASMFADWWAYKMEVQDAIPQCGPIMAERGAIVSYNSDSDELARRLNVECGKAVKYSGSDAPAGSTARLTEAEAFAFVTINPAKQLKIDEWVGSLEQGKHADVAIWSGKPTSSLSRCVRTFVDGREMFSLERDKAMRERDARERARLIQKALGAKNPEAASTPKGGAGASDDEGDEPEMVAGGRGSLMMRMRDTAADLRRLHYLNMLQSGLDPRFHRSGDCGCAMELMGY